MRSLSASLPRRGFCALVVVALCAFPSARAAGVEGALVARRGAVIKGKVEGSVYLLDEAAEITVARGAEVVGDLLLPEEKTTGAAAAPGQNKEAKLSSKVRVDVADTTALKGRQKPERTVELPKPEKGPAPKGNRKDVLESASGAVDLARTKDLTIKHDDREVVLPPGSYGDMAVDRGRLVLGVAGTAPVSRYFFQSLSVGPGARLELQGPSIVTVGQLGAMQGKVGNERFTQWLDLRVEGGAVAFAADSELHGVLLAGDSAVTLGPRVKARGGIICDRATVEDNARFTGLAPSWTSESSGNSLPLFVHKAARVAQALPHLAERQAGKFAVANAYVDDLPTLTLTPAAGPAPERAEHVERQAFFDAWCALFDGTGFARGTVVLQRRGGGAPLRFEMEREQFENHLWAIARTRQLRDGIRRVKDSPLFLNLFMERSLTVARTLGAPR